jgi:hypothetical protein
VTVDIAPYAEGLKNMNMALLKFIFCAILASGSLIVFLRLKDKPSRDMLYKILVCLGYVLKLIMAVWIYSSKLPFALTSDASNYYLPQALDFLSGKIPYRDFASSYSLLFLPLISAPVMLWRSVGSIVITMTLFDAGALAFYLMYCRRSQLSYGWGVAFLYTYSPVSFYWIGIVGHNGSIIAFGLIASLILVERENHLLSGLASALSFLCAKLLAILFWPLIIFYNPNNRVKRTMFICASVLLTAGLIIAGIDSFSPITNEFSNYTSGNLWYFLSRFIPNFIGGRAWLILPLISFAVIYLFSFYIFISNQRSVRANRFNSAVAFAVLTNLLFLILSKKSNTFYITMTLILIIHILVKDGRDLLRRLIPLAYIGAITTIELFLWHDPSFSENVLGSYKGIIFLMMEVLLLACYVYWSMICFNAIDPRKHSAGSGFPSTP